MSEAGRPLEAWLRQVRTLGLLAMLAGGIISPMCFCWPSLAFSGERSTGTLFGVAWLALVSLGLGGGFLLYRLSSQAPEESTAGPLRLPSAAILGLGFCLALWAGEITRQIGLGAAFLPPFFLLAGALPPLAAVSWVTRRGEPPMQPSAETANGERPSAQPASEFTWQHFSLAFVLTSLLAVALAFFLEILLPLPLLFLVQGLGETLEEAWSTLLDSGLLKLDTSALAASFWSGMFVLALVAPLVQEFCKSLLVLLVMPVLRPRTQSAALTRRQVFLLGVTAGAGFAVVENWLYAGVGLASDSGWWGMVFIVNALGAGIHPLATGLVALGRYDALRSEEAKNIWLWPYSLAVGMRVLWNATSYTLLWLLLVSGTRRLQPIFPRADALAFFAVALLCVLVVGGVAALVGLQWWALRAGEQTPSAGKVSLKMAALQDDRSMALWAVACLILALLVGLAVLSLLGGGG
ncbi:MAG: PrsW family glutamic-type intramembrane protease [Chloroflexota bacterium]